MTNNITLIDIEAVEYWDAINGNTYHSSQVRVFRTDNSMTVLRVPFGYGGQRHFMTTARQALVEAGILPKDANGLVAWCQENDIEALETCHEGSEALCREWGAPR